MDAWRQRTWQMAESTRPRASPSAAISSSGVRAVIQAIICHFRLSIESIELSYLINFRDYFAAELADLEAFADEGLVSLTPEWIEVTPRGRMIVRAICMVFDKYLRASRERNRYSRVI